MLRWTPPRRASRRRARRRRHTARARRRRPARGAARPASREPYCCLVPAERSVTIDDVRAAATAIAGSVVRTPSSVSQTLSELLGCTVVVKFENLQFVASFKERGALNRLRHPTPAGRAAGGVAVSAGNHAQGVARHTTRLGIPATIV